MYNPLITLKKALESAILFVLTLIIANPNIILNFLGVWKEMTVGAVIIAGLKALYDYLKNKNLGK